MAKTSFGRDWKWTDSVTKRMFSVLHFPPLRLSVRVTCRFKTSGSSKAWLARHVNDPYVKLAERDNHRSRAAYKLQDIQEKHKIIKSGDFVIDLGAAPGGWSVMVSKILNFNKGGLLASIDLLDMEPIPTDAEANEGAYFIRGNFNSSVVRDELRKIARLSSGEIRQADVVLSDMLMNTTGHASTDHLKSMNICYDVLEYCKEYLRPGGHLLCKYFQGSDEKELLADAKLQFKTTKLVKPKSSRSESREMYLICVNKLPPEPLKKPVTDDAEVA